MSERLKYEFLERRVREQAFVDIYVLRLPVPRYSFRVGSAKIAYNGDGEKQVTPIPFLNMFSYKDASALLLEIGEEFAKKRVAEKAESATAISEQLTRGRRLPNEGGGRGER